MKGIVVNNRHMYYRPLLQYKTENDFSPVIDKSPECLIGEQ